MDPESKLPAAKPVLVEELNNTKFDYCNFKNYSPYLMHQGAVYYYKIENNRSANNTVITLYKYDLARGTQPKVVKQCKPFTCPGSDAPGK
jgi:hypothetical protein